VVQEVTVVSVYIVRPGDTLSGIAIRFCGGNANDYWSLARASGISNPNVIYPGQRIVLRCASSGPTVIRKSGEIEPDGDSDDNGQTSANGQAAIPGIVIVRYSYYGLEQLWASAGGSTAHEAAAACIAEKESGGYIYALSPTNDYGLWQIHNGGSAMYDAYANARRAIAMSSDGTDWSQWTTHSLCGV
jgi:hypothetical protein